MVLLLALICLQLPVTVQAAQDPEFLYELSIDGKETKKAEPGDVITVTLTLHRTDAEEAYLMYAMQDEIRYDSSFFELVPDSEMLAQGVQFKDVAMRDDYREAYMNYLSLSGGVSWKAKTRVGTFQLKVIGTSGSSTITNEDYRVSKKDGSDSYVCQANSLTVTISNACSVTFKANGGSVVDSVQVEQGEKLNKPADPTKEGMEFAGWYCDIDLQQAWNFEEPVTGNMTLYAKWTPKPVEPDPGPVKPDPGPVEPDPVLPDPVVPQPGDEPNEGGFPWWILLILLLVLLVAAYLRKRRKK